MEMRKRIEFILEKPFLERLIALLDEMQAPGYTVIPAKAGRGRQDAWTREGMVTDAGRQIIVVSFAEPVLAETIAKRAAEKLGNRIALISLTDAAVYLPG